MKNVLTLFTLVCFTGLMYAEDTPKAELFGGFSYSRGDIDLNMYGWNASIAGVVNDWFSIVGDLSGNYADIGPGFVDAGFNMHSFAVGPQFSARGDSAIGFARALVGVNRLGAGAGGFGGAGANHFELVAGGGVDIPLNERFAIRAVQADWIHVRGNGGSFNQARISGGLVVRF
jgi:hypothetical protein